MKVATAADVKARFGAYLDASQREPVVVTRKGRPVAVLVSVEEDWERLGLARSRKLRSILEASRRQIRAGRGIAHEEFWNEVEHATLRKGPHR